MSVSGNRVRTIPRDQDKYYNSGGNSSRRSRGQPREGEAQSNGEKYYVPGRHDDTERRPSSLKNGGGSQSGQLVKVLTVAPAGQCVNEPVGIVQVAGNKIKTASKIAAQECSSLRLAVVYNKQKRRGVWPPGCKDAQRVGSNGYGETQQDVDVRLSADDIRDRLKTLKSRGGNRHMRAVSANGVLENEQINDIDVDDPRSIVRSETVSPTSHQQSKF